MSELDDLRRRIAVIERNLEALYAIHDSTPALDAEARNSAARAISATRGALCDTQRLLVEALEARLAGYERTALDVVWDGKAQGGNKRAIEEHWPNI